MFIVEKAKPPSVAHKMLRKAVLDNNMVEIKEIYAAISAQPEYEELIKPKWLLQQACENSSVETLQLLLDLGFHKKDLAGAQDAFRSACVSNAPEKIKTLLKAGYETDQMGHGYISAAGAGALNAMRYIEELGWDQYFEKSIYFYAIDNALGLQTPEVFEHLLSKNKHIDFDQNDYRKLWTSAFEAIERQESYSTQMLELLYPLLPDPVPCIEHCLLYHIRNFYDGDNALITFLVNKNERLKQIVLGELDSPEAPASLKELREIYVSKDNLEQQLGKAQKLITKSHKI